MSDWPEKLNIRDTGLNDDQGGLGQRIFTTAGQGYVKKVYVREDLAQGWISVEDRLPDTLTDVLCILKNGRQIVLRFRDIWKGRYTHDARWVGYGVGSLTSNFNLSEVTHWQPLPPPPEKDNG